jgi:hypothetical protein
MWNPFKAKPPERITINRVVPKEHQLEVARLLDTAQNEINAGRSARKATLELWNYVSNCMETLTPNKFIRAHLTWVEHEPVIEYVVKNEKSGS